MAAPEHCPGSDQTAGRGKRVGGYLSQVVTSLLHRRPSLFKVICAMVLEVVRTPPMISSPTPLIPGPQKVALLP